MLNKKYCSAIVCLILCLGLLTTTVSCGKSMKDIAEAWKLRTPAERAQITLALAQSLVTKSFEQGLAFVKAKPEYTSEWEVKVLPAIKAANKVIAATAVAMQNESLTQKDVVDRISPAIKAITDMLSAWGVDVSSIKL